MLLDLKFIKHGLLLLGVVCVLLQVFIFLPRSLNRTDPWRDVVAYFLVKERIHSDAPIYAKSPEFGPHDRSQPLYLYPPVLASILSTLPQMSFPVFARVWTLLLYGAFWIYAATLGKLAWGKMNVSGTLIAGLFLYFFPGTFRALELGQVDPLLWAFLGLAISSPVLRGAFTMAIGVIKPWGIWPLLWSLRESQWVWYGAGFVLAGSTLIGSLTMGSVEFFTACQKWFTQVVPSLAQGAWAADNRSLSFGFLRLVRYFGLWTYHGGELPFWAKNWLLAAGTIGPCLTGWYFRHNTKNMQLAGVACAAILSSPICWTTYLPVLLTLIAVCFNDLFRKKIKSYTNA